MDVLSDLTLAKGSNINVKSTDLVFTDLDNKSFSTVTEKFVENNAVDVWDIAIGCGAESSGKDEASTISIGSYAKTSDFCSIAIGSSSNVNGFGSIAIGPSAEIDSETSIAIGPSSSVETNSKDSISIGRNSLVQSYCSIAIGPYSNANSYNSIAIGHRSKIESGSDTGSSIAIGDQSSVQTNSWGSISIGRASSAQGFCSIAMGSSTKTTNNYAIAIGYNAKALSQSTIAIGKTAEANGTSSIAIGCSTSNGTNAVAINGTANAENAFSINGNATGVNSFSMLGDACGHSSIAIGTCSLASVGFSMAFGVHAKAAGNSAIAIGPFSRAEDGEFELSILDEGGVNKTSLKLEAGRLSDSGGSVCSEPMLSYSMSMDPRDAESRCEFGRIELKSLFDPPKYETVYTPEIPIGCNVFEVQFVNFFKNCPVHNVVMESVGEITEFMTVTSDITFNKKHYLCVSGSYVHSATFTIADHDTVIPACTYQLNVFGK